MKARTNIHDLPEALREIVDTVMALREPVTRLELARRYTGGAITRLMEDGHLTETVHGGVVPTPLTIVELNDWPPADVERLRAAYVSGKRVPQLIEELGHPGGEILTKAWQLGLTTWFRGKTQFQINPAWRIRRHRLNLVEAERRGLDPNDDAKGLDHRAYQRRFYLARSLASSIGTTDKVSWSAGEARVLRDLRNKGKSIGVMAFTLNRSQTDIAERLSIEGRFLGGTWTKDEDEIIIEGVKVGKTATEIARELPGRSKAAVQERSRKLSVSRYKRKPWTRVEEERLLNLTSDGLRQEALAPYLPGRTGHAARQHYKHLFTYSREALDWTETDYQLLLRAIVQGRTVAEISDFIGRPVIQVEDKINALDPLYCRDGKMGWFNTHAPDVRAAILNLADTQRGENGGRSHSLNRAVAARARKEILSREKSANAVARELGIAKSTLYDNFKHHGLIDRNRQNDRMPTRADVVLAREKIIRREKTAEVAAKELGISTSCLYSNFKRCGLT